MAKVGRPLVKPSVDDPVAIETLCGFLISGMSMGQACKYAECPSEASVYRKMAKDVEFAGIIARAREIQQHASIEQTIDLADAATPEDWQVARLRIWARQWRASKLASKHYGDRVTQDHTGSIGFVMFGEREKASTEEWTAANSPEE